MENKQLFEIFSYFDKNKREELLRCVSKEYKSNFCTAFVCDIASKKIPIHSDVQFNFVNHCCSKFSNLIDYSVKIKAIQKVTVWVKNQNLTFEEVINSEELYNAFQVLLYKDSRNQDFQIAGEFIRMAVLLVDTKTCSHDSFIQKVFELGVLCTQKISIEKMKVLCRIFVAVGDKIFQRTHENQQQNKILLWILVECFYSKDFCEFSFPFWKKISTYLKSNRRYDAFIEEFIMKLTGICRLTENLEMETNENDSIAVFREKASEVIIELVPLIDIVKLLEFLHHIMTNYSKSDLEVCVFVISSFARKIDRSENVIVPKIIEFILQQSVSSNHAILEISVKLLGQLDQWISSFNNIYLVRTLIYLGKIIQMKMPISSAATVALSQISETCGKKMEPYLMELFEIYENLKFYSLHSKAEIGYIKGLTIVVWSLPDALKTPLLRHLCDLQLRKIEAQKDENGLVKSIDELAEIYYNLKTTSPNGNNTFGELFINHWPHLSNMLDFYQSNNKVMKKITECVECAIPNLGLSVLPVLDQIVKRLIYHYGVKNYDFLLRIMGTIVDKLGCEENCKDGLFIMFEGASIITFNVLHDEKELKFSIIDDYFRLVTSCLKTMTVQLLKCPLILQIIELSIQLCKIDEKASNRSILKFLSDFFSVNQCHQGIKLCVEQAMSWYCEPIVKTLMESSVFNFDVTLIAYVTQIIDSMKAKSAEGFEKIFSSAVLSMPLIGISGKRSITDDELKKFIELFKSKNLSKTEMTDGIIRFRKQVRGC